MDGTCGSDSISYDTALSVAWWVRSPSPTYLPAARPPYFRRLVNMARRKGLSLEDSEDVVQEAFLRLHVYRQRHEISNEEGFLRCAVHNLIVDQFRRVRLDVRRGVGIEGLDDLWFSDLANPERIVLGEQALSEIERQISSKIPSAGEILLAHKAGYTHADIAHGLQVAQITVKRRLAKAHAVVSEIKASNAPAGDRDL